MPVILVIHIADVIGGEEVETTIFNAEDCPTIDEKLAAKHFMELVDITRMQPPPLA